MRKPLSRPGQDEYGTSPAELMTAYPVSPLVNSPRNDDPRCMQTGPANPLSGAQQ
jgi:hypothetical protein